MNTRLFVVLFCLGLVACGEDSPSPGGSEEKDGGVTQPPPRDSGVVTPQCDPNVDRLTGSSTIRGGTVEWRQFCSAAPGSLLPGAEVRQRCSTTADCQEILCSCTTAAKSFAARTCGDGLCRGVSEACLYSLNKEPRLCQ
ncbi:hypothetical protein [Pyxidicoccus caerfyrddinensis]|uniref:hypothetical protein n=1 Tax=Pyxidicoccus caerfyrddinensis TaxID=2709663 RepID=UPI0013DC4ABD|nr:hypothetical protein [Pyxidicoccus caerfyrddinensis]